MCRRSSRIILTSGRLVEYEGGDETRSRRRWLAELQQEMFVEIIPTTPTMPGQERRQGCGDGARGGQR